MHFRSVSCREETASGLRSSQDKCQDMLPVMDARTWQAQTHLSACPLLLFLSTVPSLLAGENSGAAQGWWVKAAGMPAEISAVFPI